MIPHIHFISPLTSNHVVQMSKATIGSNPSTMNRVTTTQDHEGPSTSSSEATAETEHEVEGALLLNVVIRKSAAVLELLASEDETLLVRGDTLLVLNLRLDVVDGIGRLNLKGDSLTSQGLDEDLHASTETEHCSRVLSATALVKG